ncbi:glutathione S-transferase N-terminal domain-containing protein [Aliiglaciecola sp. LCG003]|uniref:glutathione S-transferase N-terminal domain-containing protein n=1 Tax=Aliiglaciecola sp. LCG003 TaxID=3053655 RepID=UPI00257413CC|nr:glutathione S-transferase N-terminal domain-containing protein [Aliiglaciecola sp. LCG003]WJG10389.1 glutathione S-transferase N-terminal domain-containing protein [Aliiglaciecola sp. LCG003]
MTDPNQQFVLYGAPVSLYTGKARAYLSFKQIPFTEQLATLKVYKNIIVPNTGVKFIPVVKTPQGQYIQDTSEIIAALETRFTKRAVLPNGPKQKIIAAVFEIWADEWLVIPAMHYRWNKDNFPFIYEEFGRVVAPSMPKFIRRFLGKKLAAKFQAFVPLLGITTKSIPAIEDWYENHVLAELDKHFYEHDYLLGSRPCIGDFGLFGPLYAHLYRDPASGQLMKSIAPNVARWVERLNSPIVEVGDWLDNDEIPETLLPLLKRIFSEFWPVLLSSVARTQEWFSAHPDTHSLPRSLGKHSFTIGGVTEQRAVMSFHAWKFQRILELYLSLSAPEKASVQQMMHEQFGLRIELPVFEKSLKRVNNRLYVASVANT